MLKIFLFIFVIINCSVSISAEPEAQWSGFGTLGITLSDSNQLGYRNSISTDVGVYSGDIDFESNSLLGGQVDVSLSKDFDFLAQVVLRQINDAKASDYVTMAFIKYSPSTNWSFRLGRLIPDLFNITEYRHINVAYTWANVPNEVYAISPFNHLDGADVIYKARLKSGTLNYKFFIGKSKSVIHAFGINEHFKLSTMVGTSISYDEFDWNIQGKYTKATFGNNAQTTILLTEQIALIPEALWPNRLEFSQSLNLKGTNGEYYSFSGQKEWNSWLFSFELGRVTTESNSSKPVNSGYFSGAYRQGANTYYGLYSLASSKKYVFDQPIDTQYFPELIENIERSRNFYSANQHTFSIGWRRDITTNLTSKLQLNVTEIDEQGASFWLRNVDDNSGRTVTSIMYALSFTL